MTGLAVETLPLIWTDNVRKAWELPREMTVSEWADECRILDHNSAEPGQWHTGRTPYLRGIMDALRDPLVEDITIMSSTQIGKTEAMLNMLGYAIDQDPAPAMWVHTIEADAKEFCSDRIQPMIRLSPALSSQLTNDTDDITKRGITFRRMKLYIGWANSPAVLSSKRIRYLFLDETDKYPPFSGKEADPIKLSTERTRTFWNRKIVKCSTPTLEQGFINREYQKTDQRRYYVPCPHCGEYQVLVFPNIKFPKDEWDPEVIQGQKLARYECEKCDGIITDAMKQNMLLRGVWCPGGCHVNKEGKIMGEIPQTSRRGFWINCLYSPWLTFSEIAAEFLRTKGEPEEQMNFINSWLAEIWKENLGTTKPDQIKALALPCEPGIVPAGVRLLTAGVDVQKDHFYFAIRGWGVKWESWQILSMRVETWEDIITRLFNTYYPSEIRGVEPFPVMLSNFDTGYRTDEVYDICRAWMDRARPIKGKDHLPGGPYKQTNNAKNPGTGAPIPGGLKLWLLDTAYYKNKVARLMHPSTPESPKLWHLHRDPEKSYVAGMCSEHKTLVRDKRTRRVHEEWRPVSQHAPTHFWDCEVYATAAAEMLRVYALRDDQPVVNKQQPAEGDQNEAWIQRRPDWIQRNG
jgi:phage terminase large subunit GpA-like protein